MSQDFLDIQYVVQSVGFSISETNINIINIGIIDMKTINKTSLDLSAGSWMCRLCSRRGSSRSRRRCALPG